MGMLHLKVKPSSEFVIFENCTMQKKNAALVTMHVTTFSDHSMWKFMNSVWNRKWVVWHKNKWSYICSIILLTYRTLVFHSKPHPPSYHFNPKSTKYVYLPTDTQSSGMDTVPNKHTTLTSDSLLQTQAVYSSETLLPRPHVILT